MTCSAACRYRVTVVLGAKTAKRLGFGARSTTIATTSGALIAAGKKTARLTLTAKARKRLRRARSALATLRLTVTDAAGKISVQSKAITLRR